MTLSEELTWRGFVNQTTFKNLKDLDSKKWTFYHGFDASADSQQVGNLASLMLDRVFMRHGHTPVILLGGATTMIGDPGGKESERSLLDEKTTKHNIENAEKQIKSIFGKKIAIVNNYEWLKDIKLLPFLRDIGKHFSMTPLVQRDYIAKRIGENSAGISFTEFTYTLLQGYDFLYLYDKKGVTLQLSGSDQWGNILSGVELVRRTRGVEVHGLTMPLILNKATGKKFGKSEEGTIWLDENKTNAYHFYQFWVNVYDEGVESYLKVFTELDKPAINVLMAEFNANRGGRIAQRVLAYEVTKMIHGKKRADEVKKASEVLFGEGDFLELAKNEMHILRQELPVVKVADNLADIILSAGLAASKTEARHFLESGAIFINGQKAGPHNLDLFVKGNNLLKRGKNRFAIIEK